MKSPETPQPKSFEEVSELLREKRISYSELPEILANLRNPKHALPAAVPPVKSISASISIPKPPLESPLPKPLPASESAPKTPAPTIFPSSDSPGPPTDHSLRSQLAALDESLKREQRYRRQFEEASAKATMADELRLQLEATRNDLESARHRESELQSQITNLRLQVSRTERDMEALGAMQSALAEAQNRVDDFASRLKEAELRGALAAHLEGELTKARFELAEAKIREQSAAQRLDQSKESEIEKNQLRSELESAQKALLDASNREETLHIQLAEAHGAITIARQIESELDQNHSKLKAAEDQIATLTALLEQARADSTLAHASSQHAESIEIQRKIQTLKGELASLQFAKDHAESQIRSLIAESTTANTEIQRLSESLVATQSLLHETETRLSQATSENTALRHELSAVAENANQRLEKLSTELSDLRPKVTRIPALESELFRIQSELADALAREKILQNDADALVEARNRISEIDAALRATQTELQAARQSESQLEAKLKSAIEISARVVSLEAELAKTRSEHAESLVLIEQLRSALTHAQESANLAHSLRAEISSQVITLREAEVRRHHLEAKIEALEAETAQIRNHAQAREAELQSEITRLAEEELAAKNEIAGYREQLDQLKSTIHAMETTAEQLRSESEHRISELQSELDAATQAHGAEATALRAELTRVQTESESAMRAIQQNLDLAHVREQSLTATIETLQKTHAESIHHSQRQIAEFEQSIQHSLAATRAREATHAAELATLKSQTASELDAVRREVADREAQIAHLSQQLLRAEAEALKVPQLEQEMVALREQLDQSKAKEETLASRLAAIDRVASDITTLLPKVSYGPDYQIRHASDRSASEPSILPEFVGPYRAPRILQWIGRNPKQTLGALAILVATMAAGGFYFYQPSYQGLVDAPVKQLLSPIHGTVLTAVGEPGMSVTKGQLLFTIKNANDGRDLVRNAKEQTMAIEEEINYLETARASLLQRQIAQGITGTMDWAREPASPISEAIANDLPDSPDDSSASSVDYLALRISDINAKLEAATGKLEIAKSTLVTAEEEFRKNEKAEVASPTAGAIQTMRVSPGSTVETHWPLAEIVNSEEAFIEAAIPAKLADHAVGRRVRVTLEGSTQDLPGEIVAIGPESGWNSKQTAVSLSNVPAGYVIADVWITQPDWAGDVGFASQIGRKAKVTLK